MPRHSRPSSDIVALGPLPPPVGGASITFEVLVAALARQATTEAVNDTSPTRGAHHLAKAWLTDLWTLIDAARRRRPIVYYANTDRFGATHRAVRWAAGRTPVAVGFFGSDLGLYLQRLPRRRRQAVLRSASRVALRLVETELCREELRATSELEWQVTGPVREAPSVDLPSGHTRSRRLVYCGRISASKGVLEVCSVIRSQDRWTLHVAGPIEKDVAAEFEEAATDERIAYHGTLPQASLDSLYRSADASVLLSTHDGEGYSGSVAESMMAGTPAIVSRHRVLPEMVEDGVSGFVVDGTPGNTLADALRRIESMSDQQYAALRDAARARASLWSADRVASDILARLGVVQGRSA